jgi:hypothetical protein
MIYKKEVNLIRKVAYNLPHKINGTTVILCKKNHTKVIQIKNKLIKFADDLGELV